MKRTAYILVLLCTAYAATSADFDLAQYNAIKDMLDKNTKNIPHNFEPETGGDGFRHLSKEKRGGFIGIGARTIITYIEVLTARI